MPLASEAPELVNIDGQGVNIASQADLIERVRVRMRRRQGFCVYTLNLDHLVKRRADAGFRAIYGRGDFVTADGAPIVALARSRGVRLQLTTGADLVRPLCAMAAREGVSVYLYGSTLPTLTAAAARLGREFPGLTIAGCEAPPFGLDPQSAEVLAAGERMRAAGAHLCLVALGAPRQEIVSDRLAAIHPEIGFLCIGAALDFIAGTQIRAPALMRRLRMEWVWRMLGNPRRLFWRYFNCALLLADLRVIAPLKRTLGARRPDAARV